MTSPTASARHHQTAAEDRIHWGRRRPYILLGGILVAITFVALWQVPRDVDVLHPGQCHGGRCLRLGRLENRLSARGCLLLRVLVVHEDGYGRCVFHSRFAYSNRRLQDLERRSETASENEPDGLEQEIRHLAAQAPGTNWWLRAFEIGIPLGLCLAGLILVRRYPLSEQRMYEIKDALADRHKDQA